MTFNVASSAINGLNQNLDAFGRAASRISDPDQNADITDIAALKQAESGAKISVAVLNKVLQTTRLVDIIA